MRLGLGSPWTRAAFTAEDRHAVEAKIPEGYRINVIAHSPVQFRIVALVEHDDPMQHPVELFRTGVTYHPVEAAASVAERLWLMTPVSYLRCAACGHKLDPYGACDSCSGDREAGVA
ncbi:MAG TPA: hypothetical protein VNN79_22105 [Actinomycetota bacterium]|nr:hypothetical protein [Actinomycetota bacterium]